jgi:hypothetical protein
MACPEQRRDLIRTQTTPRDKRHRADRPIICNSLMRVLPRASRPAPLELAALVEALPSQPGGRDVDHSGGANPAAGRHDPLDMLYCGATGPSGTDGMVGMVRDASKATAGTGRSPPTGGCDDRQAFRAAHAPARAIYGGLQGPGSVNARSAARRAWHRGASPCQVSPRPGAGSPRGSSVLLK